METNIDLPKSQFSRILQMMSLNNFGLGLISIFIPIYLLQLGYTFQMVMLWMIIQHSMLLLGSFVTIFFSNRIGLVHCLHIRFVILLSYLLLIFILPTHGFLFFIIPILIGLENAFYWIPLNILFVRNTDKNAMGGALSKFFTYPKIFSMWTPLIGAFVIARFGFPSLFVTALVLVFIAVIPLLPLRSEKTNFTLTWQSARSIWKTNKKYFIPEVIDNFTEDAGVVLTIFIYLTLLSTTQIGIIGTLASLVSIFFTLAIGKVSDRWNKHKLLTIGAVLVSCAWFLNFFVGQYLPHQWLFYAITIMLGLSLNVFLVPYQSMLFNSARKTDAAFIVLREIPTVLGRVIMYACALLLYNHLPALFLLVGILFVYFWFLDTRKFIGTEERVQEKHATII